LRIKKKEQDTMQLTKTSDETKDRFHICQIVARFRSTEWAAVTLRSAITLALLGVLLLIAAHPAQAETEAVLYSFNSNPDGANPESRLTLNGGNLYGTTHAGGLGSGTVFELSPNGSGGWTETVLYNFCPAMNCADGANPTYSYVTFDSAGNLYGTAYAGGANGYGVVFELSPGQSGWTEQVLYSFANSPDGANPVNGLVMDAAGNLYGTTYNGGAGGNGAVFELSPSAGRWTEQVIYDMNSTHAGLAIDGSGNLYGVNLQAVFELSPNGSGGWKPTLIHKFAKPSFNPNGTPVLDSAGNLYGTTYAGGTGGDGTVYKLSPNGKGQWTMQVVYTFATATSHPLAGVAVDSNGNLYGTTTAGGLRGLGVIYELSPNGSGGYKYRVLQAFNGENGNQSYGSLIFSAGYLYGTTYGGGSNGFGTVFASNPSAAVTTTTLKSSPNPSTFGQLVTFTATVTPAPPDGEMITFEMIAQAPLVGGVATFQTSNLPVGKTNVRAIYFGDLNFLPSKSSWITQVVK
jgi:uncharacterized repeat protein (TIGR03803 family)